MLLSVFLGMTEKSVKNRLSDNCYLPYLFSLYNYPFTVKYGDTPDMHIELRCDHCNTIFISSQYFILIQQFRRLSF